LNAPVHRRCLSRGLCFSKKAFGLTTAGIDVKLKTRVTSVDIKGKALVAEAPGPRRHNVTWDYLIIATGSKVWPVLQAPALSVPGAACVSAGVWSGWSR
jgi:predicted flavoprotein YhiN